MQGPPVGTDVSPGALFHQLIQEQVIMIAEDELTEIGNKRNAYNLA